MPLVSSFLNVEFMEAKSELAVEHSCSFKRQDYLPVDDFEIIKRLTFNDWAARGLTTSFRLYVKSPDSSVDMQLIAELNKFHRGLHFVHAG